ncbi:MAG: penicillin-binding protein 2 [Candidatus Dependentiae bacterium]
MDNAQQLRTVGIFLFFCICYSVVILNLFFMQIYQHAFFYDLAEKQYKTTITHTPERALIFDRNNTPIALNKKAVSAFICPNKCMNDEQLFSFLHLYFPQAYIRYQTKPDASFMFIQRNLTKEQIDLIKTYGTDHIQFIKEPHRHYPFACLSSIIGITNIDNIGSLGIEYLFDTNLKGKPTSYTLQKDARSGYFYFDKVDKCIGNNGNPINVTIDADLQFLVQEELQNTVQKFNAQQGSVLVFDPTNGDILVMANYPTFDPNNTQNVNLKLTKNYCISEQYELGSVIKVFAALAALQENVVDIDEEIDCKNSKTTYIDGRRINTTIAHGTLTFSQVIEKSNNIGIALVAKRLNEKLYEHYQRVGFGIKTDIHLPGEQKGFINPPKDWSQQSVISLSYGYEITTTLLQLARAFSVIANDGYMVQPRIILNQQQPIFSTRLYDQSVINDIKQILQRTTLQGTARRARMQGYDIMCKTGTANLLENGIYIDTKNSYSCAGIIQKDDYKRIIITYIKEASMPGLYASQVAVPLFEKVAQKTVIHDKII